VSNVIVGRPYKTFFRDNLAKNMQFNQKTMEYWQGVAVETYEKLPVDGVLTKGCRGVFSNRSLYVGPRQSANPVQELLTSI